MLLQCKLHLDCFQFFFTLLYSRSLVMLCCFVFFLRLFSRSILNLHSVVPDFIKSQRTLNW